MAKDSTTLTRQKVRKALLTMRTAKYEIESLDEQRKAAQGTAIDLLAELGERTITVGTPDGTDLTGTVVTGERVTTDEVALKNALTPAQWKKVTRLVVDKALLESAVASGDIDIETVTACSTVKENAPYIRLTEKGA